MYTPINVHITTHKVDIHKEVKITYIKVCIHNYEYSYTCMYTQI